MFRFGNFYMACISAEDHFWIILCIQIQKILKHDSSMKTMLDLQSTPHHWGGDPRVYEKLFFSTWVTCGPVILQQTQAPPASMTSL